MIRKISKLFTKKQDNQTPTMESFTISNFEKLMEYHQIPDEAFSKISSVLHNNLSSLHNEDDLFTELYLCYQRNIFFHDVFTEKDLLEIYYKNPEWVNNTLNYIQEKENKKRLSDYLPQIHSEIQEYKQEAIKSYIVVQKYFYFLLLKFIPTQN